MKLLLCIAGYLE